MKKGGSLTLLNTFTQSFYILDFNDLYTHTSQAGL